MHSYEIDGRRCIMFGAGGHARVIKEMLYRHGIVPVAIAAYFVDEPGDDKFHDKTPLYAVDDIGQYAENNTIYGSALAIGSNSARRRIWGVMEDRGLAHTFMVIASRHAILMSEHRLEEGTVVMPGAVVEPGAKIGKGVILNTGCSVGHDSVIGDFTHIAPGARIGGGVTIGENCLIGINACVNAHLEVGDNNVVPSGKAVIMNIPAKKEA